MADLPVCPRCQGTTWIVVDRGNISGVRACPCRAEGRASRLEPAAQIPPLYRNASLDNFEVPQNNLIALDGGLTVARSRVAKFIKDFPNLTPPGLLLIGHPGTGKTHLAAAALRALIARGFPGLFWHYGDLLEKIRDGYDPESGASEKDAYQSALDIDVLLLDDIGARRVSDWVEDTITSILTYRCNNSKALIATTNLPMAEAGDSLVGPPRVPGGTPSQLVSLGERIGARACSRLMQMCTVIRMPAVEDYRARTGQRQLSGL